MTLLERLGAAKCGNSELDGEIWCAINGYTFVMWDGAGCVYRATPTGSISHEARERIQHLSTSLEAALSLVPEGWNRRLSEDDQGRWWAELRHGYETSYSDVQVASRVATPALAFCIAALRARASQKE
jgi:hypothetical protein